MASSSSSSLKLRMLAAIGLAAFASSTPLAQHGTNDLEPRQTATPYKGTYKSVMYYPNWDIYGRNFQPQDLPADRLTHVLYSFANVRPETGEVYLSDTYADLEKHYANDSWSETGNNVYGCVKQLYLLKKKNRYMKTLLSIGGWTYSANFAQPISTEAGRQTFANSSVTLLKDLGFDGIDVDFEYPQDVNQARNFVSLLQAIRSSLNTYSSTLSGNPHFLLTVASPAGPTNFQKLDIAGMDSLLDFWNLMAYDYAGSWDTNAGHQANLYRDTTNPTSTPFSTEDAINFYVNAGVNSRRIILGLPLYGRAFTSTLGPGTPFTGIGSGSWENGVWDYKSVPQSGAVEHFDSIIGASWSYDASAKIMVSYDNVDMVQMKVRYIQEKGLGGAMWWEANGDRNSSTGGRSLVDVTVDGLGRLDGQKNWLSFPFSRYENLKAGFPGE